MNCSLGVLECFKGDSTGHECLKELYECSQECKEVCAKLFLYLYLICI